MRHQAGSRTVKKVSLESRRQNNKAKAVGSNFLVFVLYCACWVDLRPLVKGTKTLATRVNNLRQYTPCYARSSTYVVTQFLRSWLGGTLE